MSINFNTLPDIYDKEKNKEEKLRKKIKKGKYHVHLETENVSFIKLAKSLEILGIENNDFFLALYDKRLIDIDPYDEDLTDIEKAMVLAECKRNFWYFIREVVRIPVAGGVKTYAIHRGNLALSWCLMNNINFFIELPRQNFKSVSIDVALLWLYNFGTRNSQMLIMNKDHKEAKSNLARIKEMRDVLPEYLRFNKRYNEEGKELKIVENVEDITNFRTRNRLVTLPSATSKEKADQLGRGATQPVQWYDEFGFIRFNMIIYESASPACEQASIEAEANGKPHCKMISTTPGDMNTEYGRDADAFRRKCCPFMEEMYNWDRDTVAEYVRLNSDTRFLHIVFNYRQLGRTQKYYEDCIAALGGNMLKVRREVDLEWLIINENPIFDEKALPKLAALTEKKDKIKTVHIDQYYTLDIYENVNSTYPVIISCDVSSGSRKDYSTITVIDTKTKRVIAEFKNNSIDTTTFSAVIYSIATKIYRNSVIVIERNNVGASVLTNLMSTDIKHKLYFEENGNEIQDKLKNGRFADSGNDVRNYGLWTTDTRKEQMHEYLIKVVNTYPERVATPRLNEEIQRLIYNKKGQIDHPVDGHDDLVMAYLIGMWVYLYGKNINKYGIIRFPDIDPESGMSEIEEIEKIRQEQQANIEKMEQQFNALVHSDDSKMAETTVYKTIKDFYDEIDDQVMTQYERDSSNIRFDSIINGKSVAKNSFNVFGNSMYNSNDNYGANLVDDILDNF